MEQQTNSDAKLHSLRRPGWLAVLAAGLFCCVPTLLQAQFAGGTGTAEDPFLVATAAHLNEVRNHLLGRE